MTRRLEELRAMLTEFEVDFEKFYEKSNNAAGTRVRKHMAALAKKAKEIRLEVQSIKNERKAAPAQ